MKLHGLTFFLLASIPALAAESALLPPPGARLLREVHASGAQIYACEKKGGSFEWKFKGPDADLFDEKSSRVGTHFAGPTWKWNDDSSVVGELLKSADATEPTAIPSLLLRVKSRAGNGLLTPAGYITRTETHGGKAPASGCDEATAGREVRMPYTATYRFYRQ